MHVALRFAELWSIIDAETWVSEPLDRSEIDVFQRLFSSKLEDGKIVTGFQVSVSPPSKLGNIAWPGSNGKDKKEAGGR